MSDQLKGLNALTLIYRITFSTTRRQMCANLSSVSVVLFLHDILDGHF
jgi:hypothetical protein